MPTHPQLRRCFVAAVALGIAGAAGSGSRVFAAHSNAIGDPSAANGWSTTGAVSVRNGGGTRPDRPLEAIINGFGIGVHGAHPHGLLHTDALFPAEFQVLNTCCETGTMGVNTGPGAHSSFAGGGDVVNDVDALQWTEFSFDQAYDLQEMVIWNFGENKNNFSATDCSVDPNCGGSGFNWSRQGMKEVHINHSLTGDTADRSQWTQLTGPEATGSWIIPKGNATDSPAEMPSITIPFGGVMAQYVVIGTVEGNQNWNLDTPVEEGGPFDLTEEFSVSEVRFIKVPEPGALAILAISGAIFLRRRR